MWFIETDNIVRIEGLRYAVSGIYENNAVIKGIFYKLPVVNPDAGDVVLKGAGLVGIPYIGHGLNKDEDSIRLERFKNYKGDFLLHTDTTDDELVITAENKAETLTGNEFIYVAIAGKVDAEIIFSYIEDSEGNYVGTIPNETLMEQDEDYMLCIKTKKDTEQVLAKITHRAGYQGM